MRAIYRLVPLLLATGCAESAKVVRVGLAFQNRNARAAFMAADEINSHGGIDGKPLVIVLDTIPTTAEPADLEIRRGEYLVSQGPLVAVVGHGGSRGSLAAAPIYNEAEVVHLVPTGTSRLLASAGPWTIPMPPNDSVEGAFIAAYLRDVLGARRVAVFYVEDEYGVGLRDGVVAALAGGPVEVIKVQRFDVDSDMSALVDATLRSGTPDVVVVAGRSNEAAEVSLALAARRAPTRIIAGDGALNLPELADLSGPGGQGMLVATFWLPDEGDSTSARFARDFRRRLDREATATDAMVYDAFRLLARAVEEAGDEPADVRDWLLSLGTTRPRFTGVTGSIGFGAGAGPPRLVMAEVRGRSVVRASETR